MEKTGRYLSQAAFDSFSVGARNVYMQRLFLEEKYGPVLYARSQIVAEDQCKSSIPRSRNDS